MKLISIQDAYARKFDRQSKTRGLELHSDGLCSHIGKISPGCYWCFSPMSYSWGVQLGTDVCLPSVCNLDCIYCFTQGAHNISLSPINYIPQEWKMPDQFKEAILSILVAAKTTLNDHDIPSIAFAGDGAEPLLYMPVIREYMRFYKTEVEKTTSVEPWYKIYTNGVMADEDMISELKDLGFNEIRFHLGSTNFSKKVYGYVRNAVRHIQTVTIETPSWPPHRERLLKMLPVIEEIGVKHLNIIEVAITEWNYDRIARALPDGEIYHSSVGLALDDGGLVYDLIDEAAQKRYSYSILDCNSIVRKIRDERTFERYFRGALRKTKFGSDWVKQGKKFTWGNKHKDVV